MNYDVIIIGAGASGLIAAIAAARNGFKVLVIEHKEKAGKKILATGNGKCNFTNIIQKPECYRSKDSSFAMQVISRFDVHRTLEFFEDLGIYPKERNGYYYPNSEQAASVVQVLVMECERLGVTFVYQEHVSKIKAPNYTVITEVTASNDKKKEDPKEVKSYYTTNLIMANGGCASPQLGSDGSGFELAKALGHKMIKPLPALVQLVSKDKFCKTLAGVRSIAKVVAYVEREVIAKEEGEILFTDYGISGIPIMQMSRFVAQYLDQSKKVKLIIDFLPVRMRVEVNDLLEKRIAHYPNKSVEQQFIGLLNHKLAYIIIKEAGIDPLIQSGHLKKQEIQLLTKCIKEFHMNITDTNSFQNAQVSAGGIDTSEINAVTMESKLMKNLYVVGEIVDVDGTCGGYNLQWAWSSGFIAGSSIRKKL